MARVLVYHSIGEPTDVSHGYSLRVGPARFEEQLAHLREHCAVVPLERIASHIADRRPFEPNTIAITFDDGYRDNYTEALPLLQRYGLPATVFISSGVLDGTVKGAFPYMTGEEIRSLAERGVTIGSHLHEHVPPALLGAADAAEQLRSSKRILEEVCGRGVDHLSYPYGGLEDVPEPVKRQAAEAGYRNAYSALFGGIDASAADPFFLPRIPVTHRDTLDSFARKCRGEYDRLRALQIVRDRLLYDPASQMERRE